MLARLLVIQHVPWERPGLVAEIAEERGVLVETILMTATSPAFPVSSIDKCDGVVIMGGPMGALDDEQFPSLAMERELARTAVSRGIPILGICLGHQIIAVAMGAELLAGATDEVGVGTVELFSDTPEFGNTGQQIPVLHWHRDNITTPPGSTVLAGSPGCPVQAFRLGSAIGVQFHIELTPQILRDLPR